MEDSLMRAIRNIALFPLALLTVGCTSTDEAPRSQQSETVAADLDKVKTESREAARAMQDYSLAQRAEFVARMRAELARIDEELDRLSTEVDGASVVAKTDAKAKLESVREKWAQTKNQLDQAESATEATWDSVRSSFRESYDDLKDSFDESRQWVSDRIEP
jgi:DNA repair exonuclease SbcCD ATPase subunit